VTWSTATLEPVLVPDNQIYKWYVNLNIAVDGSSTLEETHLRWVREAMAMVGIQSNAVFNSMLMVIARQKKLLQLVKSQLVVFSSGTEPLLPKPEIAQTSCET
jgi:hypothetical protein